MDLKKKWIINGFFVLVAGIILLLLGIWKSETLQGMGAGMIGAAALNLFRRRKICRDEEKMQEIEIQNRDERNIYISTKSQSLSFWISVLVKFLLIIIFCFLGKEDLSQVIAFLMCGEVVLYAIISAILSKKY